MLPSAAHPSTLREMSQAANIVATPFKGLARPTIAAHRTRTVCPVRAVVDSSQEAFAVDVIEGSSSTPVLVVIGEQGVDRTSGYPACLSTNAAVDTSNETSNTNGDVNSAADNGVDETDESRSGAGGQLEEVTRSSSASKKWRCILLAPVFPSYSVAILSRRIVPDLRPSASQCTASVKGDSGDSTD